MKTLFLTLILIVSNFCISQSKKEQIELLNKSVDSLEKELSIQKDMTNQSQIKGNVFETENKTLKNTNLNLQSQIVILKSTNESLTNTLGLTKYELQQKEDEIKSKNNEISNLQTEMISIKDSLIQLRTELNKTPKNTKNDVSNKNNSSNSEKRYYDGEIDYVEKIGEPTLFIEKSTGKLITGIICSYKNDGRGIKADGTMRFEQNIVNGIKNGKFIKYQGEFKMYEGNYKNGKQDGIWKEFHNNGRVRRKTEYRNGTVWEDRCYDTNGDEIKPCPK